MHRSSEKRNQSGVVYSLELLFWSTCVLCMAVIIWGAAGAKIVAEWSDVASAVGSLDQSYSVSGMAVYHVNDPVHNANNPIASWAGSSFTDNTDFCDEGCDCGVVMCIPPDGETDPIALAGSTPRG